MGQAVNYDEALLCDVCGNRHVTEKRLTTEALLDLITQRQTHFEANWRTYDHDQMERALHNLHRLGEHADVFKDRLREALTMDEQDYEEEQ